MDVRICGPNLNDQSKGTFHVHKWDCKDLHQYGPGKPVGGEIPGMQEMLVHEATIESVVRGVYDNGIIDEMVEPFGNYTDRASAIDSLVSDFHFFPCCGDLPHEGVVEETVYECWIGGDRSSWCKLEPLDVPAWVADQQAMMKLHQVIHIVPHLKSEYSS